MLEVLGKSESIYATHRLLNELVRECLLEGTDVHISTHAVDNLSFHCVLIHPFMGVKGQTDAVLSSVRSFLKRQVSDAGNDRQAERACAFLHLRGGQ